jgi:hypothetical protein
VAGAFQYSHCRAAAKDILLRPAGAGDADATDDDHSV